MNPPNDWLHSKWDILAIVLLLIGIPVALLSIVALPSDTILPQLFLFLTGIALIVVVFRKCNRLEKGISKLDGVGPSGLTLRPVWTSITRRDTSTTDLYIARAVLGWCIIAAGLLWIWAVHKDELFVERKTAVEAFVTRMRNTVAATARDKGNKATTSDEPYHPAPESLKAAELAGMVLVIAGVRYLLATTLARQSHLISASNRSNQEAHQSEDLPDELALVLAELDTLIGRISSKKEDAMMAKEFQRAAALRAQADGLEREKSVMLRTWAAKHPIDQLWLTRNDGEVLKLVRGITDSRSWDLLPTLADALEAAGCADAAILSHCRKAAQHSDHCWVTDLLSANAR